VTSTAQFQDWAAFTATHNAATTGRPAIQRGASMFMPDGAYVLSDPFVMTGTSTSRSRAPALSP
jgi:hypothetical protein